MTRSIRRFFLFNLITSLIVTTALTLVGTLLLEHHDIEQHSRAELVAVTLFIEAMLGSISQTNDLNALQEKINQIPTAYTSIINLSRHHTENSFPSLLNRMQFQVWDKNKQLVLLSKGSPKVLLTSTIGFGSEVINDERWDTFSRYEPNTGYTVIVAMNFVMRDRLEQRLAQDYLFITFLTAPLFGILIWIIVGKGLNIISRVANEIAHRAPSYLEPVDLHSVPQEIEPLVDELNKLLLRLQQAFEREKRFAADAAHELRTPLAALKTQAQVALEANNNPERAHALTHISLGVDRCTHIIQQLLTLSCLVPEATLEDPKPFNLIFLAKDTIALLVPSALEKNIEIELEAPENPLFIMGNTTAIGILIRNLVDNAIRYTPEYGQVTVFIHESAITKNIILRVVDNGPGIPAELRARVFERFFRVLGNKSPGSGLGLAIVQQITSLHKAKIRLGIPSKGTGLEVIVEFPAIDS